MKNCLLCLQISADGSNYIPAESPEWLQLNIQYIIEKHLWPIDDSDPIFGICSTCWYQLYDFHTFYTNIKEIQERNIKIDVGEQSFFNLGAAGNNSNLEIDPREIPLRPKIEIKYDEPSYTNDEIIEDIDIDESLLTEMYEPHAITFAKPKGKRGRPRKKCGINEMLIKKPKGKRGRPRKYDKDINVKHQTKSNSTAQLNNRDQNGHPPIIKRRRGRPCKIKNIEDINYSTNCDETAISSGVKIINSQNHIGETEVFGKEILLNLNDNGETKTKDLKYKKLKLFSNLKKRKRSQQHKAIMRNYIATSVRCMEFLKK